MISNKIEIFRKDSLDLDCYHNLKRPREVFESKEVTDDKISKIAIKLVEKGIND